MKKSCAENTLEKKDLEFLNSMNFCPLYFEKAVEHFYNTTSEYETRYNSWVQCYNFFKILKKNHPNGIDENHHSIDDACVRLGFYMASWGMYRGSSFLLQNDYTIYKKIIPILLNTKYNVLWELDDKIYALANKQVNSSVEDFLDNCTKGISDLIDEIRHELKNYKRHFVNRSWFDKDIIPTEVSKTLVTKLILGTIGCYPAIDRYFGDAIGLVANDLDKKQIKCIFRLAYYICENLLLTKKIMFNEKDSKNNSLNLRLSDYPIMKLIDMYYFTFGMEKPLLKILSNPSSATSKESYKIIKQFVLNDQGTPKLDLTYPCFPTKQAQHHNYCKACPFISVNLCKNTKSNFYSKQDVCDKLVEIGNEIKTRIKEENNQYE